MNKSLYLKLNQNKPVLNHLAGVLSHVVLISIKETEDMKVLYTYVKGVDKNRCMINRTVTFKD